MTNPIKLVIACDGPKNAVLQLTGKLTKDIPITDVFTLDQLTEPTPKAVRIESVTFAIQEKMGFLLYWKTLKGYELILPLESRGYFNFEPLQGYHSPKDLVGMAIESFGCAAPKSFLLCLDLTKQ